MIIQCERCNRKFKIDDSLIKPPGSRVRCSKCGNTFFVEKKKDVESKSPPETEQGVGNEFEYRDNLSGIDGEKIKAFESKSYSLELEEAKERLDDSSLLSPLQTKEPETDISKGPTDAINWEKFVSITKSKAEEGKFNIGVEKDPEVERKGDQSGFNWSKLSLNDEPEESFAETPQLFDEPQEEEHISSGDYEPVKEDIPNIEFSSATIELTVDREKLLTSPQGTRSSSHRYKPQHNPHAFTEEALPRKKGFIGSAIKKLIYAAFTVLILAVIIGAGMIILANQGLIPKEKVSKVSDILSGLPIKLIEDPGKDLIVSDLSGKWLSTRNGLVYVVSGNITNQSKNIVNYVRVKTEFASGGKSLFERVVYAGNTFSEDELKILPLDQIWQRLSRKNGDIDFNNPNKLAGLNYGIEPGESVPFFAIFPSESQILGLKYQVEVEGFDKSVSSQ